MNMMKLSIVVAFISMSEHSESIHVVWLDKVSDEEYNR